MQVYIPESAAERLPENRYVQPCVPLAACSTTPSLDQAYVSGPSPDPRQNNASDPTVKDVDTTVVELLMKEIVGGAGRQRKVHQKSFCE